MNGLFHKRLREIRKSKNVSLDRMAEDLGTTKSTLSRYENGLRDPKGEVINRIADYFKVSISYLVGQTDDPHDENSYCEWKDLVYELGIENIGVFKKLFLSELTEEDFEDLLKVAIKIKKRHNWI